MTQKLTRSKVLTAVAMVAVLFGVLTIYAGGRALFGGAEARAAVGNAVPFVLWFNFLAGFAYIMAGIGLIFRQRWAVWLSAAIAVATLVIFSAFGVHVVQGGAYEMRTVGAMTLRSLVWLSITAIALRRIWGR